MKTKPVRIDSEQLETLRSIFPELAKEKDAAVIRIALRSLIETWKKFKQT